MPIPFIWLLYQRIRSVDSQQCQQTVHVIVIGISSLCYQSYHNSSSVDTVISPYTCDFRVVSTCVDLRQLFYIRRYVCGICISGKVSALTLCHRRILRTCCKNLNAGGNLKFNPIDLHVMTFMFPLLVRGFQVYLSYYRCYFGYIVGL